VQLYSFAVAFQFEIPKSLSFKAKTIGRSISCFAGLGTPVNTGKSSDYRQKAAK
jgi:hypothetical protein